MHLLGGTLVFLIAALVVPRLSEKRRRISRMGYNLYNSGIAALASAWMLTGIMEIAGIGSKLILFIVIAGAVLMAVGIACQVALLLMQKTPQKKY